MAEIIRGRVVRLHFSSPTFSAGKVRLPEGKEASFAGKLYVRDGDVVTMRGEWSEHAKFGRQFQVEALVYEDELDTTGLAAWLVMHDAAGIGPKRAEKIAKEYGKDFGTILREDPEQIAVFSGVPLASVLALAAAWGERTEFNALATKLAAYELTRREIEVLCEEFGAGIVNILKDDPYLLIGRVARFGFKTVDEIAKKSGVAPLHPGRLNAAMLYGLSQIAENGDTCGERLRILSDVDELLVLDAGPFRTGHPLSDAMGRLVEARKIVSVHIGDDVYLAREKAYAREKLIFEVFSRREANQNWTPIEAFEDADASYRKTVGEYDVTQEAAVAAALANRIVVITGTAGSGKTSIIKSIVRAYASKRKHFVSDPFEDDDDFVSVVGGSVPLTVALCAPTGKAARRLEEVVGMPAQTIHRMLGYHPFHGFTVGQVGEDVVIADEMSMADSELFHELISRLSPRTSLVIVGDVEQLPPVGPGAVMRDAIQHQLVTVSVLGKCHRQAGVLKHNCNQILKRKLERTAEKNEKGWSPWIVHDRLTDPEKVLECIEELFKNHLLRYGFDPPWGVQFMTPQHNGPLGTKAINLLLQRLHQERLGVRIEPSSPDKRPKLYIGDKVICTKNHYDIDVMNGHQGRVVVADGEFLTVQFDEREVSVPKEHWKTIELGYCLTPHKMQGSEVPCAVTVVHKLHQFMLHRNWLYTAATRARECCILIGDPVGMERAVDRVVANRRQTVLSKLAMMR